MKDFFDATWKICVLVLLLLILVAVKAHAESAVVLFGSPEQLAAISDSIVGVCDTVDTEEDYIRFNEDGSSYVYSLHNITCRELVSRTRMTPPIHSLWKRDWQGSGGHTAKTTELEAQKVLMRTLGIPGEPPDYGEIIPGTAIITWREVKR